MEDRKRSEARRPEYRRGDKPDEKAMTSHLEPEVREQEGRPQPLSEQAKVVEDTLTEGERGPKRESETKRESPKADMTTKDNSEVTPSLRVPQVRGQEGQPQSLAEISEKGSLVQFLAPTVRGQEIYFLLCY